MLKEIREYYKLHRNNDFAKFMGLSEQNAYSWTKRSFMDLELVYSKCPEINPEWLLSNGEVGTMLRPAQSNNNNIVGDNNVNNTQVTGNMSAADSEALNNAIAALAENQKLFSKYQEQIDTILNILNKSVCK